MSFTPVPNNQAPDPASYVFPNDGDPLVVASVNQALQNLIDNASFSQLKTRTLVNVRNYGAAGNGSTDDLAAFNAATAAIVSNSGSGILLVPPGFYRLSNTLVLPGGVSIVGVGHPSLLIDHATAHLLTFSPTGLSPAPAVVCRGLVLGVGGGTTSNTGSVLHDDGGRVRVLVQDCSMSPTGLDGQLIALSAHTSAWTLTDCFLYHGATTNVLLDVQDPAYLWMERCTVVMPATGSHIAVRYNQASGGVHDCVFDFSAHANATGSPQIAVLCNSDLATCSGNVFRNTPAVGRQSAADYEVAAYRWNFAFGFALGPDAYYGVYLPFGGTSPIDGSGTPVPLAGPYCSTSGPANWYSLNEDDDATFHLPEGYQSYTLDATNATSGPTVNLPAPTRLGQVITVNVINHETGTDWTFIRFNCVGLGVPGAISADVNGIGLINHCITQWTPGYNYTAATWIWYQVGTPTIGV